MQIIPNLYSTLPKNSIINKSNISLNKKDKRNFFNYFYYVYEAPVITAPGYENRITSNINENIHMYRLLEAKDICNKLATDYEAMLYIHTASFFQPLSHRWYKIYLHTFSQYHDVNQILSNYPMEKMKEHELDHLQNLKSWIHKRQSEYIKDILKK